MEKKYDRYTLAEKEKLADVVEKYKVLYDKEVEEKSKLPKQWDPKRKTFVTPAVQWGYLSRSVKEVFPHLAKLPSKEDRVIKAVAVARRAYETRKMKRKAAEDLEIDSVSTSEKKFRAEGGGRKAKALEVRQAAFEWMFEAP